MWHVASPCGCERWSSSSLHFCALLTVLLEAVEFRYLILDHSVGIYVALVAALFAGVGIWLGQKLTRTRETVIVREVPVHIEVPVRVEVPMPSPAHFVRDER